MMDTEDSNKVGKRQKNNKLQPMDISDIPSTSQDDSQVQLIEIPNTSSTSQDKTEVQLIEVKLENRPTVVNNIGDVQTNSPISIHPTGAEEEQTDSQMSVNQTRDERMDKSSHKVLLLGWLGSTEDLHKEISESINSSFQESLSFTLSLYYEILLGVTIEDVSSRVISLHGSIGTMATQEKSKSSLTKRSSAESEQFKSCLEKALCVTCWNAVGNSSRLHIQGTVSIVVDAAELVLIQLDQTCKEIHCYNLDKATEEEAQAPSLGDPDDDMLDDDDPGQDDNVIALSADQLTTHIKVGDINVKQEPDQRVRRSSRKTKLTAKKKASLRIKMEVGKSYECETCHKEFKSARILKNHIMIHTDERPYACEECGKAFRRMAHLRDHLDTHDNAKPDAESIKEWCRCDKCPAAFSCQENLDKHMAVHTERPAFECAICSRFFKRKSHIVDHVSIHTREDNTINALDSIIERNPVIKGPMKKEPAQCQICNKHFKNGSILDKHLIIHTGERPFHCEICHKAFRRKAHLQEHKLIHTIDEDKYFCDICGNGFKFLRNFEQHKLVHSEDRPFKCRICHKAFKRKKNLIDHASVHSDERPHMCDVCGLQMKSERGVEKHIEVVHCDVKRFACPICDKKFAMQRYVDEHLRIHSDVKSVVCDECGASFRDTRALRQHKLSHAGIRSHVCDICNKAFVRKGHLEEHKLTHEQKELHYCDLCGKGFRHKGLLANHQRLHASQQQEHKCEYCNKIFSPRSKLNRHINKVHKKKKVNQSVTTIIDVEPEILVHGLPITFVVGAGICELEVAENVQLQSP